MAPPVNGNYKRSRSAILQNVLKDTSGKYQLLCANCNSIKAYENNERIKAANDRLAQMLERIA